MESTKNELINNILFAMQDKIDSEGLSFLKDVLLRNLYGINLSKEITEISVLDNDNEKYIKLFAVQKLTEELSQKTVKQYVRAAKNFLDSVNKNFRDISTEDILYYFLLLKNKGLSATSRDNERRYIKCFFNWLHENDYISKNPFIKIKSIKQHEKQKEVLTGREIEMIRDECKNNVRDLAIIDFLLATGVRVSECVALNISDVDFVSGRVSVYGNKTHKWRTVFLDDKALKHLQDYIYSRTDTCTALFINKRNKRISASCLESLCHSYSEKCGIQKHCTVHTFRKTLAYRLHNSNMDISEIANILGHSVQVLCKYYLYISIDNMQCNYKNCM